MARTKSVGDRRRHRRTYKRGGASPKAIRGGTSLMAKKGGASPKAIRGGASLKAMKGGYSSAATYGLEVNGGGPEQYARTYSTDSPYAGRYGSEYVGAQGQWANQPATPTPEQLSLIQSAGRRRRRGKRGGFLGPVITQAIVPATILGLQQTYGRRGHSANKTFKNRFSRRR